MPAPGSRPARRIRAPIPRRRNCRIPGQDTKSSGRSSPTADSPYPFFEELSSPWLLLAAAFMTPLFARLRNDGYNMSAPNVRCDARQSMEMDMQVLKTFLVASAMLAAGAGSAGQPARADGRAVVVLDNAKVRVLKTTGAALAGIAHGPGVVVPIEDG